MMLTRRQVRDTATEMYGVATNNCEGGPAVNGSILETLKTGSFDEGYDAVQKYMTSVEKAIKGVSANIEASVPEFLATFNALESKDKVAKVSITVKSKLKAKYSYKEVTSVLVGDNFLTEFANAFVSMVIQLYYVQVAGENIDALNEYLEGVYDENEIGIRAYFTIGGKAPVASINDEEVVFNISTDAAHGIGNLTVFDSGDAYQERCAKLAKESFIESMKAIQATPELIKAHINLITDLTEGMSKKRVNSILKAGIKTASRFTEGQKPFGLGYIESKQVIDGVETTVFAIVENTESGIATILKPFDTKTLLAVDIDVDALIRA